MAKDMRRGSYQVPGNPRIFTLPQDIEALDAAWAAYLGAPAEAIDDDISDDTETKREGRNPEYALAKQYAATYSGTFQFMLDMKAKVTGPKGPGGRGPLSDKMVAAILKCRQAELDRLARAEKAKVERVQTGRDLTILPEGRTYAAVDNDSGGVTFLIIDRPKAASSWAGWVFVKQQVSDDEVKLGSQRPGESYVGQWSNLIDKVLADPTAAVARYGLELGVCGICNRTLTNDASRELGIGPVCLAKLEKGY
jgi:hypothetical protein